LLSLAQSFKRILLSRRGPTVPTGEEHRPALLSAAEDRTLRLLKDELQLTSNTDFLSDAVALFRWAVWERKLGHRISMAAGNYDYRASLSIMLPLAAIPVEKRPTRKK
jgi:hypothetical protein